MVSRTRSSNLIPLYVRFCSMARERCCHEADRHRTHNGVGSEVEENVWLNPVEFMVKEDSKAGITSRSRSCG